MQNPKDLTNTAQAQALEAQKLFGSNEDYLKRIQTLQAELDAEREAHAETKAALDAATSTPADQGEQPPVEGAQQ